MKIALGADHAGFHLKEHLRRLLGEQGHELRDFGAFSAEASVDYPEAAATVGRAVRSGEAQRGILVCGTGLGMAIAANKISGIRAVTCNDLFSVALARSHNDANILALGSRVIGLGLAEGITHSFLETECEEGRHRRRIEQIHALE